MTEKQTAVCGISHDEHQAGRSLGQLPAAGMKKKIAISVFLALAAIPLLAATGSMTQLGRITLV